MWCKKTFNKIPIKMRKPDHFLNFQDFSCNVLDSCLLKFINYKWKIVFKGLIHFHWARATFYNVFIIIFSYRLRWLAGSQGIEFRLFFGRIEDTISKLLSRFTDLKDGETLDWLQKINEEKRWQEWPPNLHPWEFPMSQRPRPLR